MATLHRERPAVQNTAVPATTVSSRFREYRSYGWMCDDTDCMFFFSDQPTGLRLLEHRGDRVHAPSGDAALYGPF